MSETPREKPERRSWRRRRVPEYVCTICEVREGFCWTCPCGFQICKGCMEENAWGMTCNHVTWECPDCGAFRVY